MNEQQALQLMVPPSQRRPSIWRQGVMQIWVTRACDKACCGCTQGSNLAGRPGMITTDQYAQALDSLRGYFGVIGMFGGNPSIHPHFKQLCAILRDRVPYEQRGIWCNHPLTPENAKEMALTFNPNVSNLNLHQDQSAYDMFAQYWPGARHQLKGLTLDSEHTSWWRSPTDLGVPEEERWERISQCDVNQLWSAMIYPFRGRMVGSICEIMGAMDMLKQDDPNWPDTGIDITQKYDSLGHPIYNDTDDPANWSRGLYWWQLPIEAFREQVKSHCHHCMMPYKDRPLMANGNKEEVTEFWKGVIVPKKKDRLVQLITTSDTIQKDTKVHATDYVKPHQL